MLKPIIILGPTAVGKTAFAIKLARSINAEIISSDSVQIYKYMDIGTAKPTKIEQNSIKHHLIDIKNPDETFSSGEFRKKALSLIKKINEQGKNVIIVGGGGFYIDSLVFGIDEIGLVDEKIKRFFDDICDEFSASYLYDLLCITDERWAEEIKPQDCQRIKRGLSVYIDKKKELSGFFSGQKQIEENFTIFVLYADKKFIDCKIEKRVDKMIEEGLIDEVKNLIKMGFADTKALKSIGYKEVLLFLRNEIDEKNMAQLIKKNTKRYAKRQMTMLRSRFGRAKWINVEKEDALNVMLDVCKPSL